MADGISTIMTLRAILSLDTKGFDDNVSKSQTSANKFASALKKTIAGAAVAATAAVGATATAIANLTKAAVSQYADYEQLVGGISTLYEDLSYDIGLYAEQAYKTAGLSANEYMETAIGFAASLNNSLMASEGNIARSADLTDQIIVDMADNVNKMGTSMEAVQNAYRGFSRGNYTMLDNLALGFAGTKEGMEELLAKAEEFSGVEYNIESFADIAEAIHVVQTEMGITGTTAKEASETISGSMATMKASWTNFTTALANPEADIGAMSTQLVDSIVTVKDNLMPVIQRVLVSISQAIPTIVPMIAGMLPMLVNELLPSILSASIQIVQILLDSFTESLPIISQAGIDLFGALLQGITENLPQIVSTASQLVSQLIKQIVLALPVLLPLLMEGVSTFFTSVMEGIVTLIPTMIPVIVELVQNVGMMLIENLPLLLEAIVQIINALLENLPVLTGALLPVIVDLIIEVGKMLLDNFPLLLEAAINMLWAVTTGLFSVLSQIFDSLAEVFERAWNEWIIPAAKAVGEFFSRLWDDIVHIFSVVAEWFDTNVIQPVVRFFLGLWDSVSGFFSGLWEDIKGIWSVVSGWFDSNIIQPVVGFFSGLWDSLSQGASDAWEGIKSAFSAVSNWFKDTFSKAWQKVKDVFSTGGQIFSGIKEGIENTFKTVVNAIIRGINTVVAIPFNAINGFLRTLRNVQILGWYPFSWISEFGVPRIPELARGGVLKRGQVGVLEGDGAEAVVPLERNKEWIHAVAQDFGREMGGATTVTINVYGAQGQDVNELAEIISRKINDAVARDRRVFA